MILCKNHKGIVFCYGKREDMAQTSAILMDNPGSGDSVRYRAMFACLMSIFCWWKKYMMESLF